MRLIYCLDKWDHFKLRRAAVETQLYDDEETPNSEAQIQRFRQRVYEKNGQRQHVEFCFVLDQACGELLSRAQKQRARREAIRRQQR